LTDAFRDKSTFRALFNIELAQLDEIETATHQVVAQILNPTGSWLDIKGRILDMTRDGLGDVDYGLVLGLRQQAMQSSGTIPDLLALADAIAAAFIGSPSVTTYTDAGLRSFTLTMTLNSAHFDLAKKLLASAKPAGRRGNVQIVPSPSIGFLATAAPLGVGLLGGRFEF
jgi:hypothetical protein